MVKTLTKHPIFSKRAVLCTVPLLFASLCWLAVDSVNAVPPEAANINKRDDTYAKRVAKSSDEGVKAIKRFQRDGNLAVDLWAAEPLLANPVAFCVDEKGRVFVAETYRLHAGVTDNRQHMSWLNDDLASRTVADRLAMYRKHLGAKKFASYGVDEDRVRLVEDSDGDGKADRSSIFAAGFNNPADGLGSGVLARHGKVWYTCIPDLWLLEDRDNDGHAEIKKSLSTGYGIHVAFLGHDLHGLKIGPDGKLYFSIGDRGLHVVAREGTLSAPDTGSVLRCDLDGSNLEIFATGLRNPQELAFDKFGNLFTGDNNADGGDQARWVHLVEGGDSGWRIGYQYLKRLGPWNAERLWHVKDSNTASYLLPPLANIASGPSGLTYHPGTSLLPDRYQDHFFLCDFRGGSGNSGIRSFAVQPNGASYKVVDEHQFLWRILATDADFAPDGNLLVSDWTEGWGLPFKGRIYKVHAKDRVTDAVCTEVSKLLATGMAKRTKEALAKLLDHADMRVRQEAQFELASRNESDVLNQVANSGAGLARLHAIWGLGQIARKQPDAVNMLVDLLKDGDAEVRAQACKILGDSRADFAVDGLISATADSSPRVRFYATIALGKAGKSANARALTAVVKMLRGNADADPYLRHAGVMALTALADGNTLRKLADDPSRSVRLGSLLALRRMQSPDVARFLNDVDPHLVLEAARAINDAPIPQAMPALAAVLDRPAGVTKQWPAEILEPLYRRSINAQLRLGKADNALALARFASRKNAPESARVKALDQLADWSEPTGRDEVVGLWRPLPARPRADAVSALQQNLAGIITGPDAVRGRGAKLAAKFGIKQIGPALTRVALDSAAAPGVRVESLRALQTLEKQQTIALAEKLLTDKSPQVRHESRTILFDAPGHWSTEKKAEILRDVIAKGALLERQGAFELAAKLEGKAGNTLLAHWLDELLHRKAPDELELDIVEAASKRDAGEVRELLKKYRSLQPKADPLAGYRPALVGGNAERGKRIFFDKTEVSCLRCHTVQGLGGQVGPDLSDLGKKQKRDYILESLVLPDKQIAKGYDTVVAVLGNGKVVSGILKKETPQEIHLMTAEGKLEVVPTSEIDERLRGKSAMPADLLKHLSLRELRDLVSYLSSLQ